MAVLVPVPVGGSPLSEKALRFVLTRFPDATITAYHVVDLIDIDYGTHPDTNASYEPTIGTDDWYAKTEYLTEQLFEEVQSIAAEHDHDFTTASDIGESARLIADYPPRKVSTTSCSVPTAVRATTARGSGEKPRRWSAERLFP